MVVIKSVLYAIFLKMKYYSKIRMNNYLGNKFYSLSRIYIHGKGKIQIGKMSLQTNAVLSSVGGILSIGENVHINRNSCIICRDNIIIKDNVSIGPNVAIYDHDHCFGKNGKCSGFNCSQVVIGNNVWIGAGTIILRGTIIGDNCVIGAGCVIKGTIPNNSIVKMQREISVEKLY